MDAIHSSPDLRLRPRAGNALLSLAAALLGAQLLVGCGQHLRIDDEALVTSGQAVGATSAALVVSDDDAPETLLRQRTWAVGEELVTLALLHDAWLADGGAAQNPDEDGIVLPDGAAVTSWDGVSLRARFSADGEQGDYAVDLRVLPGALRWEQGENGQPDQWDPVVDGALTLVRRVSIDGGLADLRLRATFVDLTLDGEDCAAGGGVDVVYEVAAAGEERGGFVRAGFHGCERVQVIGGPAMRP